MTATTDTPSLSDGDPLERLDVKPRRPGSKEAVQLDLVALAACFDAGLSVAYVAAYVGCTPRTIRNLAHDAGIPLPRRPRLADRLNDHDWLRRELVTEARPLGEIAHALNTTVRAVVAAATRAGLPLPALRHPELADADWLRTRFQAGATVRAIAAEVGCSTRTVRDAADRLGVPRRRGRGPIRYPQLHDRDWLHQVVHHERLGVTAIARRVGSSVTAVERALQRTGIRLPDRFSPLLDDPVWLATRYITDHATAAAIAADAGCATNTVRRRLAAAGLHRPRPRRPAELDDPDWLRDRYLTGRQSRRAIAAHLGVPAAVVTEALAGHGIAPPGPRRPGELNDADWLRTRFLKERRSRRAIAAELGISARSVSEALARHGIAQPGQHPPLELDDPEWLRRHRPPRRSIAALAEELAVREDTVRKALRRHGLYPR